MRYPSFVITTIVAICAGSFAHAADLAVLPPLPKTVYVAPPPAPIPPAPVAKCGDLCEEYKSTRRHFQTACENGVDLRIRQPHSNVVVLRFYDAKGKPFVPQSHKKYSNVLETLGVMCIEREDLQQVRAMGGHIDACNDVKTKTLRQEEIDVLLERGMPATASVHLFAA